MKKIFRTDSHSSMAPSVTKLTFFLNNDGKLSKITTQTCFLEKPEGFVQLWAGDEDSKKEWDFNDANADDLRRYPFRELALRNPPVFKELYYTLKKHDEKMFPIIHSVLLEIQEMYNFN